MGFFFLHIAACSGVFFALRLPRIFCSFTGFPNRSGCSIQWAPIKLIAKVICCGFYHFFVVSCMAMPVNMRGRTSEQSRKHENDKARKK